MSHELRTPMNAIIGVTEMLLEDAQAAAQTDQIEPLERILRAGRHLLALINDILDLSKIEAGKMELSLESFALAPLVEDVVATIRPLAEKNGNQVDVECAADAGRDAGRPDAGPPGAAQSRQQRRQVHRARPHPDHGDAPAGRPRPRLGHHGGRGHRHRHDGRADGEALPGVHAGRRLDHAQVRRNRPRPGDQPALLPHDGRRHHGDEHAGQGSTFTIRLPADARAGHAAAAEPRRDRSRSPPRPEAPGGRRARCWWSTTTRPCATSWSASFKEGFSVVTAANGIEGLRRAREVHPAAITLDVMMPDLDGWTVLAALKGDPALADIPVILVTIVDEKDRGYALGATDYMVKPIDRERLASVLRASAATVRRRTRWWSRTTRPRAR